jgi:glycerophosphoryl diester phosphodiesterase
MPNIMNKSLTTGLFFALILTAVTGRIFAQGSTEINILKFKNTKEFQQYFKHTAHNVPVISGHRGGTTTGYPENCIATFENTLKHTPAFFEIDPRLTKDSVIVVMHDATLDRTTTGKGKISDYTFAELQQLRLKDPQGNVTEYKIPTLKEMLLWSKGKTILNLDHKDVPLKMTAKLLKECKNEMVMLTVHDAKQARFYYDDNANRMMSAFVLTRQAFDEYEKAGVPWKSMIAYIGPINKPENQEMYNLLHAKGVMCMISAAPSYDKLKVAEERAQNYRETFKQGADILESDLPIEVAEAIKPIMPATGTQMKFWSKLKLK